MTQSDAPLIADAVRRIRHDGFAILPGVLPADDAKRVCAEVVAALQRGGPEAAAERDAIRAKGHVVGVPGVDAMRGVVNETRAFAPWLVEPRLAAVVDTLFDAHVRVTCTDAVINHPGCERGYWHADWPHNQTNASHVPAPYPDELLHLATIWMLTDFTTDNGGTLLVPGSHRFCDNPSADRMDGVDRSAPYPTEFHAVGAAGSVLVYDSRLWHAVPPNRSASDRVALIVRFAPWWLNLEPTRPGSTQHTAMVVETDGKDYAQPELTRAAYDDLPEAVRPLYRHWVVGGDPERPASA